MCGVCRNNELDGSSENFSAKVELSCEKNVEKLLVNKVTNMNEVKREEKLSNKFQ